MTPAHIPRSLRFASAWRIVAVVGVVFATSFSGTATHANHTIQFTECGSSQASPTPTPSAELTPPPTEPPVGGQTPPPQPEPTPPPQNCMPPSGDRIWGSRTLQFSIDDNNDELESVRLSIVSEEPNIPSANSGQPVTTWTPGDEERTFSYQWNSLEATPHNGRYKVVVAADASRPLAMRPHTTTAQRTNLRVDNPPKPVGVAPKVIATTLTSVTLEWPAGTEPDITGYTVYRATTEDGDVPPMYSQLKPLGFTTGAAYRDSTVKAGFHWYAVRVTRRSIVTPETGISSAIGPISKAAKVESIKEIEKKKDDGKPVPTRFIPYRRLAPPRPSSRLAAVPDAPFKYKLPYDDVQALEDPLSGPSTEGGTDPRGAVLPVAVGMFLVSSALAVGRMPY